jgi:hypothetical protein
MNFGQTMQMKDILLMKEICMICNEDFTAHSFNHICNTLEGGDIFYTKVSNASKYDDTDGITKHFTNYLNYINPEKWSWVVDCEDFGLKHTFGIKTGIQLALLFNRVGGLKHIIFINANTILEQMLKIVKLTLNKDYQDCICVLKPNDTFRGEIEKWTFYDNKNRLLKLLQ